MKTTLFPNRLPGSRQSGSVILACILCALSAAAAETNTNEVSTAAELKNLSLEELMDQEVRIVSRRDEKLSGSPSAVQVITQEDIRRSGATSIPEALRLASNLQVAQVDSQNWAIDSRGFNNTVANKLLVMIDGRTIYTPLFAGVLWDVQQTLLADIDRIEVVSGPGATLWGANAVNGVINVVTKSAKATQGLLVEGIGGSFLQDFGAVRYGGSSGSNFFYRVYAQRTDQNSTVNPDGSDGTNAWAMTQGGFRSDWFPSDENQITFQGDVYSGTFDQVSREGTITDGQNVLGRWTHTFSEESDLTVQTYFDRTWRHVTNRFSEDLKTWDCDFQHRFQLPYQSITWGGSYRLMLDRVGNSANLAFIPANRNLQLFSGFLQDEIALVPDRLKFIVGTKVEHNDFSGIEVEPSGRIAWTPDDRQTIWSAVSRAVRSPSRADTDLRIPGTPPFLFSGGSNFKSEDEVACELGYRVRPYDSLYLSLATFYNFYNNIRSLEPVGTNSFVIANGNRAETWGVELSGNYRMTDWWRFRGGYTYLNKHVVRKEGSLDLNRGRAEGNDPGNQFLLQSMTDLPHGVMFDLTFRYVDDLPFPEVPDYFTFDARLAWRPMTNLEISVVGQNLWENRHAEWGAAATRQEIPRSIYGKVSWSF